jgi:RNA polymerase sigma factor (TIGR02999 family)
MGPHPGDVTVLLERLANGDRTAEEALLPRVYLELHRIATARFRGERKGHTLQPTALVHEAYLKLCKAENLEWQNRAHFFRVAAMLMRRILVDYARQKNADKRAGGVPGVPLEDVIAISDDQSATALEVDEVLLKLAKISPRQAQVVEMRFFGGLTEDEIALAINRNVRTVRRDWLIARAWLHEQLRKV